jgi:hypothetical protein
MVKGIAETIGFVTLTVLLAEKWGFFTWWDSNVLVRLKYSEVCYLCFCFWLSVLFGFLSPMSVPIVTVFSRYLVNVMIGK